METDKLIKELRRNGLGNGTGLGHHSGLCDAAADCIEELVAQLTEKDKRLAAAVELQQSILEQAENLDSITNYGDGPIDADEALCRLNMISRMIHGNRAYFSGPQEAGEGGG